MSISDSPAHASCEAERVTVFDRMRLSAWIFMADRGCGVCILCLPRW